MLPIAKCIFCLNGILNRVQVVCTCYLGEKCWFLKRLDFIGRFFNGCTTKKKCVFFRKFWSLLVRVDSWMVAWPTSRGAGIPENCPTAQTVCLLRNQMVASDDSQGWSLTAMHGNNESLTTHSSARCTESANGTLPCLLAWSFSWVSLHD